MKTTGYFENPPSGRPWVLAHRGLVFLDGNDRFDENSLEAFQNAIDSGADMIESDIQVSKDGVALLFHDRDFSRLLGKKTLVGNLTWAEIQEINLPKGGKIPSLEMALKRFPNSKFNLDIKLPRAESVAIQTILNCEASKRVLVSSFSEASRIRALNLSPSQLTTSAGSSKVISSYLAARVGQVELFKKQTQDIHAFQVPTSMYGVNFTKSHFVKRVLEADIELHYWTINETSEMANLFELGATGIVTDRTDLARKLFS
jgi:glycerophosphoryl diester phosphodiesterase